LEDTLLGEASVEAADAGMMSARATNSGVAIVVSLRMALIFAE
jgi:hypothetical protein